MSQTTKAITETSFYVRYAETDAMGVVHHASYLVYLEEGRSHYSREHGYSYAQFEQDGFFLMVTEVTVQYKRVARYGQQLTVRTWLESLKSRSLVFGYEVIDHATQSLHVTATSAHICMSKEGQIVRLPQAFTQQLQLVKRIS